jgi:hypothetical protein
MITAMYGDQEVMFAEDGEFQWHTGRNGRLHVDEPDGSVRGNHPYLSAVAVVRCTYAEDARVAAWLRQRAAEYPNPVVAYAESLNHAERAGVHGEAVSLDVFETVSQAAVPLPRVVFDGPTDTRWGKISEGRYGQLVPRLEADR